LDGVIIGEGYNSMPCDVIADCFKDNLAETFKSDKTCCIHAEQRAIISALKNGYSDQLKESTLFFIRLDSDDNAKCSGEPYCSICSKMALDVGIKSFVLWHKQGWISYNTKEYNERTFEYK
jgi:deoxycytidylate deaminase